MWLLPALFAASTAPVAPFLLNALCFTVGGGVGLFWLARRYVLASRRASFCLYHWHGTAFFYHALDLPAQRLTPPAEVNLITFLWPLFIVLASGLVRGDRLRTAHRRRALIAFFAAPIRWAGYSPMSRRMAQVPRAAVVVCRLAKAALSALNHLMVEASTRTDRPLE